ncbi:universal stress protein [Arthrobacter sp. NPDC055138]
MLRTPRFQSSIPPSAYRSLPTYRRVALACLRFLFPQQLSASARHVSFRRSNEKHSEAPAGGGLTQTVHEPETGGTAVDKSDASRPATGSVLVGVIPGQRPAVVRRAAVLAADLGVDLVCVHVDVSTYEETRPDGSTVLLPIDSDGDFSYVEQTAEEIRANLSVALTDCRVTWSFRTMAGEPARTLSDAADSIGASMIVVGTREPGVIHALEEVLVGSVAVHLAHHQHRPVLIIPLDPRPFE